MMWADSVAEVFQTKRGKADYGAFQNQHSCLSLIVNVKHVSSTFMDMARFPHKLNDVMMMPIPRVE